MLRGMRKTIYGPKIKAGKKTVPPITTKTPKRKASKIGGFLLLRAI
jgi:hypothetical protein